MAMNWIKWSKGLARKPEVIRIAGILGIDRRHAAGLLMEFWEWVDDNTSDGKIALPCNAGVTLLYASRASACNWAEEIDGILGCPGFVAALENVGWVVLHERYVEIPHFDRHNGKSAKKRALTAERVRNHRASKANGDCNGQSVTEALPEKRREDITPEAPRTRNAGVTQKRSAAAVDLLIDELVAAFELPANLVEYQRRSFAKVGWDLVKLRAGPEAVRHVVTLAREAKASGHDSPLRVWQSKVNDFLEHLRV